MQESVLLRPLFDERERWFLWLPVLMALGLGLYFSLPTEPSPFWMALTPCCATAAYVLRHRMLWRPLLAGMLALIVGFNAAQFEAFNYAAPMLDQKIGPVSMTGRLMKAELLPEGSRLTIKRPFIRDIPPEERLEYIRVKVRTPFTELPEPGSRVNVWGPLWPPSEPVAPGDYDFRRRSFFLQLGASGMSYGELRERDSKYPPHFFWDGFNLLFEKARRSLILLVTERQQGPAAAMTSALLSGSQSSIERPVMDAMRVSGLSHLLSISGVHVSMVGLLIYAPLRFLLALFPWLALRFPIKKWAAAVAIIATSFYTVLVGPETPTVRSALMTGIVMFAIIADRKAMSLRLVALAAGLLMLMVPSAAIGPSFQMSFAAVLAMVAAYEKRLDEALKEGMTLNLPTWLRGSWRHLRDIAMTSLIATAATAPFTIFHFQTFSFLGVIANMIAIPLTSFWIMPCLLLVYLCAPFGLAGFWIDAATRGNELLIALAEKVAAWPYSQFYLPPMPSWAFLTIVLGGLWLCLWHKRWRYLGLVPIALGAFYPLTVAAPLAFVAEEGPLWAVMLQDGRLATYGKRTENFTLHQWRQRSGNPDLVFFSKKNPPELGQEFSCDQVRCIYKRDTISIVFLSKKAGDDDIQLACLASTLVVAPTKSLKGCDAPNVIDADALRQHGSYVISQKDDWIKLTYVREKRGQRPWSIGWGKPEVSTSEPDPQADPEP